MKIVTFIVLRQNNILKQVFGSGNKDSFVVFVETEPSLAAPLVSRAS
jgi:hypothetical protein